MTGDWEGKRTEETKKIEDRLRAEFARVDAYRFNSASIRVRVVDPQFEGKPIGERDELVLPLLMKFPKRTREDILFLLTLAPSELEAPASASLMNLEFEHPRHSLL